MDLDKLFDLAEKENIKIYDYYITEDINGMYLNYYKLNAIALNYKNIENSKEEMCVLSEELGHYYCNALYNSTYSNVEISKKEFRATKWAFKTLIPFKKLETLYEEGCRYTYEFAEELGVTEDLIEKAYNYYSEGNYGCKN